MTSSLRRNLYNEYSQTKYSYRWLENPQFQRTIYNPVININPQELYHLTTFSSTRGQYYSNLTIGSVLLAHRPYRTSS